MNSNNYVDFNLCELQDVRMYITDKNMANATSTLTGWSLLMNMSLRGKYDIVDYLISQGADVNYSCPLGWTALMLACTNQHFNIVKLLISNGANVNAQATNGFTPVMFVMLNVNTDEMREYLIQKGADMKYALNWLRSRGLL